MIINFENSTTNEEIKKQDFQKKINIIHNNLHGNKLENTGWLLWPNNITNEYINNIQNISEKIKKTSNVLLVIGIGGSYLGAYAGLNFIQKTPAMEIVFLGTNFDGFELQNQLKKIENKNVFVNVISKSGTTLEILATFNVVENFMIKKYGKNYKNRIVFTTDNQTGYLHESAIKEQIETLSIPKDIGGRYSVLTSVGLLPFACAGFDINKIILGAKNALLDFNTPNIEDNNAYKYAIHRFLAYSKFKKNIEVFAFFSNSLKPFGEWLQQLFMESEGKEQKGLYICPQVFSRDLHSVGQFLQDGTPCFIETIIKEKQSSANIILSNISENSPIFHLNQTSFNQLNDCAKFGAIEAHKMAKTPLVEIEVNSLNEYNFGYLVYFFELACAVSGLLLDVDPFNQPGVEKYKSFMKKYLKKN